MSANPIADDGAASNLTSLTADATQVYGGGYFYTHGGDFEGRFAMNPDTGAIIWMNSCHGDTYATFPMGQVLYSASHEHECTDIGAFSQTTGAGPAVSCTTSAKPRRRTRLARSTRPSSGRPSDRCTRTMAAQPIRHAARLVPDLHAGHLHRPKPSSMVGLRQLQVHLLRWRIPDCQRHQAARPRALRDLVDRAEQGRTDSDCRDAEAAPSSRSRRAPRASGGRRRGTRTTAR